MAAGRVRRAVAVTVAVLAAWWLTAAAMLAALLFMTASI